MRSQRTHEAQQRKVWSKEHGHHTYGEEDIAEQVEEEGTKKNKTCKKIKLVPTTGATSLTIADRNIAIADDTGYFHKSVQIDKLHHPKIGQDQYSLPD